MPYVIPISPLCVIDTFSLAQMKQHCFTVDRFVNCVNCIMLRLMLRQAFFFGDSLIQWLHGLKSLGIRNVFEEIVSSFIFSLLSPFPFPLPFWPLPLFVFVSLRFPARQMPIVARYQLETSPYPIFMASPAESSEPGLWNRWQGEALTNLRYVYKDLTCFLLWMKGYHLLPVYLNVQQIIR